LVKLWYVNAYIVYNCEGFNGGFSKYENSLISRGSSEDGSI